MTAMQRGELVASLIHRPASSLQLITMAHRRALRKLKLHPSVNRNLASQKSRNGGLRMALPPLVRASKLIAVAAASLAFLTITL